MIAATVSCGRMRDLTRLGRFQVCDARYAAVADLCASCAERLTDATGIAESIGPLPGAASPHPGDDDRVASII